MLTSHLIWLWYAFGSGHHIIFLDICSSLSFRGSMILWLLSYLIDPFSVFPLISTNSKVANARGSIFHRHCSLFILKSNIYSLFTLISLIRLMALRTIYLLESPNLYLYSKLLLDLQNHTSISYLMALLRYPKGITNLWYPNPSKPYSSHHNLLFLHSFCLKYIETPYFQLFNPKILEPFVYLFLTYYNKSISKSYKLQHSNYIQKATTRLVQAPIISHLDYCCSLLFFSFWPFLCEI